MEFLKKENEVISLIIPTRNAGKEIEVLLNRIQMQTCIPDEIIIVDSSSTDQTVSICCQYPNVKVLTIDQNEFDHGKTRDMAIRTCCGDIVIMMTQDAIPKDAYLVENLIRPLENLSVVAVTGRQLAKTDASPMEKLIREFNYPPYGHIRSKDDVEKLGIKAFFFSDVCAAYRKEIYLQLGGFECPITTNEDMFYAAKVLQSGYKIAYASDAVVYHSHNFSLKEQYQRNYIQGYEIEKHKELLGNVKLEGEGMKLVVYVIKGLLKSGRVFSIVRFGFDCCARMLGNKMGKRKACQKI